MPGHSSPVPGLASGGTQFLTGAPSTLSRPQGPCLRRRLEQQQTPAQPLSAHPQGAWLSFGLVPGSAAKGQNFPSLGFLLPSHLVHRASGHCLLAHCMERVQCVQVPEGQANLQVRLLPVSLNPQKRCWPSPACAPSPGSPLETPREKAECCKRRRRSTGFVWCPGSASP